MGIRPVVWMRPSFRPLSSLGTRSRTIARRRLSCPISTAGFSNVLAHITELRKLARVLSSDDYDNDNGTTAYLTDWTGRYIQESGAVCLPKNTREVSDVVRYCHQNNIAVVPQGGNTGLVGGGVGLDGSLVMNMQRMNTIHDVDTVSGILTCDAGCILQNLDTYLLENRQNTETETTNFMLPISMGSKSQCHIGGNIATNAGGLNVIKYGPIGRYLLGAEVVMADGAVLDMLRALPKDNMGYVCVSLCLFPSPTLVHSLTPHNTPTITNKQQIPTQESSGRIRRHPWHHHESEANASEPSQANCHSFTRNTSIHEYSPGVGIRSQYSRH